MPITDRELVAALQIDPRASHRKLARSLQTSESTVARRLQAVLAEGALRITVLPDPAVCGLGRPVLVRLRCRPGSAGDVAAALAARPDVRFLATVTGTYDLIMELIASSKRHLAQVLSYELNDVAGITHTTTDTVLRTLKTSYDWSRRLLSGQAAAAMERDAPARGQERRGTVDLDEDDLALMAGLREDGRASYKDLAVRTGLSESTVRRRFDALTRSGAMIVAAFVEPAELGFDAEFFFHARVRPDRLADVAQAFAARREVRYLSTSYGFTGLTGEVILPSLDDVYEFSEETFGRLDGINDVEIAVELETHKRGHIVAKPTTLTERP